MGRYTKESWCRKYQKGNCFIATAWKQRQETLNDKEKKAWEEKRDLVTFIAGVIHATAEIQSKMERIQIIAKAAIQHLGMVGLKWEEIRDGLIVKPSQEGSLG